MKTTVSLHDFRESFRKLRPNQFSYEGLERLFNHLEEIEDSTGVELELDVIAICCDYAEEHYKDIAQAYNIDLSECKDESEQIQAVINFLDDASETIGLVDDNIIYRQC